jgi:YVTN family beta-propeller protein
VDSAGKRLYVSHNPEVVVIDTGTNTVVGKIADTPIPDSLKVIVFGPGK